MGLAEAWALRSQEQDTITPPQPANAGVCLTGSWTPGTPQTQTRVSVMAVRYSSTGVRHSGCERAAGPQRHPLEDDVTHCLGYVV